MLLKVIPRPTEELTALASNVTEEVHNDTVLPAGVRNVTQLQVDSPTISADPVETAVGAVSTSTTAAAAKMSAPPRQVSSWGQGLIELQANYQSQLTRLLDHHKQLHPHVAAKHKPLLDQIVAVGKQMCSEPGRENSPDCAQFRHAKVGENDTHLEHHAAHHHRHQRHHNETHHAMQVRAELDERVHHLAEADHAWEKDFSDKALAFGRELCNDPVRKGYAVCAEFVKQEEAAAAAKASALRGKAASVERKSDLHWSSVAAWQMQAHNNHHPTKLEALEMNDLRRSHWKGTIPKVACVAVVPCGTVVQTWIKYFVDNFNMQHYEGPRQLILVYHYLHEEAARAVKMYADGTFIKAVAARDADYPSASTYRFGAWTADAEVIARWDFHAWHHSQRLSVQVRALAMAGRPASLVNEWSVRSHGGVRVTSGGRNWDSSLIGEASWMREHWYPSLKEGKDAMRAAIERDVVYVNASDLSIYDEDLHELGDEPCHYDTH